MAFQRSGYLFSGWNTAANGSGTSYADGATVKNLTSQNDKTVTLYAQWKKVEPVRQATTYAANGHLTIQWERVWSCDHYYIYRQDKSDKIWKSVARVKTKLDAYYDFNVNPGQQYRYRIRTMVKTAAGNVYGQSCLSGWVTALPETPVLTECTSDGHLRWTVQSGATKYGVYESSDHQHWKYLATAWGDEYTLPDPKDGYYYTVRAYYRQQDLFSSYARGLQYNRPKNDIKILFDGDSITFGKIQNGIQAAVTFPQRIGTMLQCQVTNIGESGKSMAAANYKQGYNIVEQVEQNMVDYRGYDIICLRSSATDYNFDVPLGTADSRDITTFYGAFNRVLEEIRLQNPTAKIVLITPSYRVYRRGTGADYGMYFKNTAGHTQMDYCTAIHTIAARHQCYLYDSTAADIINRDNLFMMTVDGLHPTQECYIMLGDSLAEFLRDSIIFDPDTVPHPSALSQSD